MCVSFSPSLPLEMTSDTYPFTTSLEIFAFFMLTGIFSTLLIPETKGKTLEELSNEKQDGFVSGVNQVRIGNDGLIVADA
jgi:PHS family inorganic phosphate transporter-like MFS transporter